MRKTLAIFLSTGLCFLGLCAPAFAQEFHFDGYADVRLIVPSDQESWQHGLFGKLRYGAEDN